MTIDRMTLKALVEKGSDGDLVKAMGMTGISKSQVSRLCAEIHERVHAFLSRPIEGAWPYLWIDATYVKLRQSGRIVYVVVIIAVAVNTDGRREVLGMEIGPSEAEPFWTAFLRSLTRRGLRGVKLVISDSHEGLSTPTDQPTRLVKRKTLFALSASLFKIALYSTAEPAISDPLALARPCAVLNEADKLGLVVAEPAGRNAILGIR